MFDRVPAGESIFLDSNVLLYHALEARPSCELLFRRVKARDIRAVTSPLVLSEVFHRLTLAEAVQRFNLPSSKAALNLLRHHPEHLSTFTVARRFMAQVPSLRVRVLPVRWRDVPLAADMSQRYHLLANDAFIVATMTAHRLSHLATNDEDFNRVPSLTVWRP